MLFRLRSICSFLFLRFFVSNLRDPWSHQLYDEPFDQDQLTTLTYLSNCLNKLANFTSFSSNETCLPMNELLEEYRPKLIKYLNEVSTPPQVQVLKRNSMPKLMKRKAPLSSKILAFRTISTSRDVSTLIFNLIPYTDLIDPNQDQHLSDLLLVIRSITTVYQKRMKYHVCE